jgi:hypothetical protein
VGSGAEGVTCKRVLPGVCRGRNAFSLITDWRASICMIPLRRESLEIAEINVADCVLGPRHADFCEDALLKVCQEGWFSSFYCSVSPSIDVHIHECSSGRDESPTIV